MIKKNIKLFIGIIIGGIVFGSIGAYAASKIYASSVSVDTTNMSALGASSNVDAALTYLYGRASSIGAPSEANMSDETIYYLTDTSGNLLNIIDITNNYMDLVNTGKTYFFMAKGSDHAACFYYNNELHCFRPNNPVAELRHAQEIFGSSACRSVESNASYSRYVECTGSGFFLSIYASIVGNDYSFIRVGLGSASSYKFCELRDNGGGWCYTP